jgi:excisionase family DNA binding protein
MKEKTLTIDEVADLLRVHRPHVYRWIRQGVLKADKSGEKILISRDSLEDFLAHTPDGKAFEVTWERLKFSKGGSQAASIQSNGAQDK